MSKPTADVLLTPFGRVIERHRMLRKWSIKRTALECGFTVEGFSDLRKRTTTPTLWSLRKVADGLGMTMSDLLAELAAEYPDLGLETKQLRDRKRRAR